MGRLKLILFIFLFTGLGRTMQVDAQILEVNAWLDTTAINIGEQVKLHLDVKKDPNSTIRVPAVTDTLWSGVEIVGRDSGASNDGRLMSWTWIITSFDSGNHRLPSLPVEFSFNGMTDTIYSTPVVLNVYTPLVDTSKAIMDIKPPINTPVVLRETIPYVLVSLGVIIIAAAIFFIFMRFRKKKPVFTKPEKILPAHVIAFQELDRLKEEKLWQEGQVKEFYVRLSDITRTYLENRYGFKAMEYVTDEIIEEFRQFDSDPESTEMLREILQTSDMVKFAKGEPLASDNQMNMENAYLFVEKTKYIELISVEELKKQAAADASLN